MAYFKATGTDGKAVIINGGSVTKVIDFQNHRIIYQGSANNFHQVTESLDVILARLKGQ